MIVEFKPFADVIWHILLILVLIQYAVYVVSRVYSYYIDIKRKNLTNPKYSLDDLDRIYKAKQKKQG